MLFFRNFEEFQKMNEKKPTIPHSFGTHTRACVFHDLEGFQEMIIALKKPWHTGPHAANYYIFVIFITVMIYYYF